MIREHKFVIEDSVLHFFSGRSHREREELIRIWEALAKDPYHKGEWIQKTRLGRELLVKCFGRLIRYWLDEPVLEFRIDVEKDTP
ncbi:MAG TPA: hypothetical protein VGE41_00665 [Verrucomicrobiae bacterium]|jgi:hypothetical protein